MPFLIYQTFALLLCSAGLSYCRQTRGWLAYVLLCVLSVPLIFGVAIMFRISTVLYNYGPEWARWVSPIGTLLALPLIFLIFSVRSRQGVVRVIQHGLALGVIAAGTWVCRISGAVS
ncbi:hypothetical protein [Chitinilyticum piscinae]|uniref:Uncharacterized protein n=1 Tax=Chitinilyticum piscinae TaxID=2866724 RepID=A0A8J7KF60_9NEIS|nr:hypothetical protein [Chitinilyticum piscinae]MBE9609909.1 hypothetical protein [Chitinilyticum piscinae]